MSTYDLVKCDWTLKAQPHCNRYGEADGEDKSQPQAFRVLWGFFVLVWLVCQFFVGLFWF